MAVILLGVRWNLSHFCLHFSGRHGLSLWKLPSSRSSSKWCQTPSLVQKWVCGKGLLNGSRMDLPLNRPARVAWGVLLEPKKGRNYVHPEDSRWELSLGAYVQGNSSRERDTYRIWVEGETVWGGCWPWEVSWTLISQLHEVMNESSFLLKWIWFEFLFHVIRRVLTYISMPFDFKSYYKISSHFYWCEKCAVLQGQDTVQWCVFNPEEHV